MSPFSGQYFGGAAVLEVAAGNLFALVDALDAIGPGFGENAVLLRKMHHGRFRLTCCVLRRLATTPMHA